MRNVAIAIIFGVLGVCASSAVLAEEVSREQIKGLDEQVQDIKSDVLAISSELLQLEEKLLYPSNTHVSIFVSFNPGDEFRLDAMDVAIDGKTVTHHLYTHKEIEGLRNGGVQRIYTGNVRAGEHKLEVTLIDKSGSSKPASHTFTKEVGPRLVEIQVSGSTIGGSKVQFKDR